MGRKPQSPGLDGENKRGLVIICLPPCAFVYYHQMNCPNAFVCCHMYGLLFCIAGAVFPNVKDKHVRVDCSFLDVSKGQEGELLLALHNINR